MEQSIHWIAVLVKLTGRDYSTVVVMGNFPVQACLRLCRIWSLEIVLHAKMFHRIFIFACIIKLCRYRFVNGMNGYLTINSLASKYETAVSVGFHMWLQILQWDVISIYSSDTDLQLKEFPRKRLIHLESRHLEWMSCFQVFWLLPFKGVVSSFWNVITLKDCEIFWTFQVICFFQSWYSTDI